MKILLVSDARGVHEYLYRGLIELGCDCELAVIHYTPIGRVNNKKEFHPLRKLRRLGRVIRPYINYWQIRNLAEYDVISFVHRISFHDMGSFFQYSDIELLSKKSSVLSYTALGCDEISLIKNNKILPYNPCGGCELFDETGKYCINVVRKQHENGVSYLLRYFDVVISPMIEYDHARILFNGTSSRIPFPIDISEIPWNPAQGCREKMKIVHTPTRKGFKGTDIVLKAIKILEKRRSDFEFSIIEGLNFDEYTKVMKTIDIVIDQVWSQSPGMNALWMLGMGKIVFSGNSELCKTYFPFGEESTIIDAVPDPEQLANRLEWILINRSSIDEMAMKGRSYIKKHHNHVNIAEKYIDLWSQVLEAKNT
jgi:glycosyltransferase involved in cell wall biosynthesis